jgi:hypothetical protein
MKRELLQSNNWIKFTGIATGSEQRSSDIITAFDRDYRGKAVHGCLEYLQDNEDKYREGEYYAKFCSIVQSSGMGKSGLLCEVNVLLFQYCS